MNKRRFLVLLISSLLFSLACFAQQPDFAAVEAAALADMKRGNVPGMAIAIVSGDKVVFAKGLGVASVETGAPVTPDMLFRLGSTTKMLTAATLVGLAHDGKLKLDEPIGKYITGLPPGIAAVTAHQLLSHTAGLKDEAPMDGPHDDSALAARVRSFKDDYLLFPPGKIFSYSNVGYTIAGLLIEQITGKPYATAMAERLFEPAGMSRTTLRPFVAMTYPLAQGHDEKDGKPFIIRPAPDHAGAWPAGSVFSSVQDLSRFVIAFMNDGKLDGKTVLPSAVIQKLSTGYAETHSPTPAKYGYGLVTTEFRGVPVLQHSGARFGYGSNIYMAPQHRVAVITIGNRSGAGMARTGEKALEVMLPLKPAAPEEPSTGLPMTAEEMSRYAGRYVHGGSSLELFVRDGKLFRKLRDRDTEVIKVGANWFEAAAGPNEPAYRFKLLLDSQGRAEYAGTGLRALRREK